LDKLITTEKSWVKHFLLIAGVFLVFTFAYSHLANSSNGQKVNKKLLTISTIKRGDFANTLNARGIVTPQQTIYLDAIAGGRVEEKLVERGNYVVKGQALLRLSNTNLQLDVITREAQISEQLNFLRNTQMNAETNSLNLRRDIIENNNKINHLKRKLKKFSVLKEKNYIAADELIALEQDLVYFQQRKELNIQRQQQQQKIRSLQIKQLEDSAKMLQENLLFARDNLKNLIVTAPQAGYLSELNVELGESKITGARLGQIDIPGKFKVLVSLDEYYLNLISLGMKVNVTFDNTSYSVVISKIDSRVNNGQFTVEVNLPNALSENLQIKRGQSLALIIWLSDSNKSTLLLPRSAFINSTGGHWAFVLNSDESKAHRQAIKLGKKNQQYFQVVSGIELGDKIISSSYDLFDQADTIIFE